MENQRHASLPGRDPNALQCVLLSRVGAAGIRPSRGSKYLRLSSAVISVTILTDTKHDAGCFQISSGLCALVLTNSPRSGFLALTHQEHPTRIRQGPGSGCLGQPAHRLEERKNVHRLPIAEASS